MCSRSSAKGDPSSRTNGIVSKEQVRKSPAITFEVVLCVKGDKDRSVEIAYTSVNVN
jgi:hypothetical protein